MRDHDRCVTGGFAASDQVSRSSFRAETLHHYMLFERYRIHGAKEGRAILAPARNFESRFGQTVGRVKSVRSEPTRPESFPKSFESLHSHGLGPVKGNGPGAKVERGALLGGYFSQAKF